MILVEFKEVGRYRKSWFATTKNITNNWLRNQIKNNAKVLSNDLFFTDSGFIFAGAKNIGIYKVVKNKENEFKQMNFEDLLKIQNKS